MIPVQVIDEHFNIGVTHYVAGSQVDLPEPIAERLVKEGTVRYLKEARTGYNRRDMQAENNPAMQAESKPEKPKRVRRTKAQMEAARAAGED